MTGVYCVYYRGCRASEQEGKKVRVCGGKMEGLGFFGFFVWVLGLFFLFWFGFLVSKRKICHHCWHC